MFQGLYSGHILMCPFHNDELTLHFIFSKKLPGLSDSTTFGTRADNSLLSSEFLFSAFSFILFTHFSLFV